MGILGRTRDLAFYTTLDSSFSKEFDHNCTQRRENGRRWGSTLTTCGKETGNPSKVNTRAKKRSEGCGPKKWYLQIHCKSSERRKDSRTWDDRTALRFSQTETAPQALAMKLPPWLTYAHTCWGSCLHKIWNLCDDNSAITQPKSDQRSRECKQHCSVETLLDGFERFRV